MIQCISKFIHKLNVTISTRNKIILIYLLLVFIPITAFIIYYYGRITASMQYESADSIMQIFNQVDINISNNVRGIEKDSDYLFMNTNLHNILSQITNRSTINHITDYNELLSMVNSIQDQSDIFKVRLYVNDVALYANEGVNFFPNSEAQKASWYMKAMSAYGRIEWVQDYLFDRIHKVDNYLVSAVRSIPNINKYGEVLGFLVIDVKFEVLFSSIYEINVPYNIEYLLMDQAGIIINLHPPISFDSNEVMQNTDEIPIHEGIYQSKTNYIIIKEIQALGWKLIGIAPTNDLHSLNRLFHAGALFGVLLYSMLGYLLMMFLLSLFLSQNINRLIHKISDTLSSLQLDSTDVLIPPEVHNQLEKGIYMLVDTTRRYTSEIYEARVREREAQMRALQAQINPHFLYNTLDMIKWTSFRGNFNEIRDIVDSLAAYYRLSLHNGSDMVTVNDEIQLVKEYVRIQEMRFQKEIHLNVLLPDEVMEHHIPKLTLQPLIENSILHGFSDMEHGCKIILSCKKYSNAIELIISDNGTGIPKTKKEYTSSGYGLINIQERLQLLYGNEYGLNITSDADKGTTVTIRMQPEL